jgi:hypothetical protein
VDFAEDFIGGWLTNEELWVDRWTSQWGSQALYISDDKTGNIYRVTKIGSNSLVGLAIIAIRFWAANN